MNNNVIKDVPYKPSLVLQILMFCNVYLSIAWNIIYGFYILYNLTNLYDLHGICVIIAYLIGSLVEYYRLRMGYRGNLHMRAGDLCTFLILSPLVQMPIMVFLLLSVGKFLSNLITFIMVATFVVMCLEFVFGIAVVWPKNEKFINVNK